MKKVMAKKKILPSNIKRSIKKFGDGGKSSTSSDTIKKTLPPLLPPLKQDPEILIKNKSLPIREYRVGGKVTTKQINTNTMKKVMSKKKAAPKKKAVAEKKTGEKYASKAMMAKHEKMESKKMKMMEGEMPMRAGGKKVSIMKKGGKKC
jgi:hypothetical protein